MLASLSVAVIQVVLDNVMFTLRIQKTTDVHAMHPAMREMTAVQMHRTFACVSEHMQRIRRLALRDFHWNIVDHGITFALCVITLSIPLAAHIPLNYNDYFLLQLRLVMVLESIPTAVKVTALI